jgi:hypothetical protein
MSRARNRIRRAVESRGFAVEELVWEPVWDQGDGIGYAGGWALTLDRRYLPRTHPGNDLYGMNVDELLADIDYSLKPEEPCDCDRTHSAIMAAGIINDPHKPTHGPQCKWHIKYRLPWWTTDAGSET